MRKPRYVTVSRGEVTVPVIEQAYYRVLESNKLEALCRILDSEDIDLAILFCRTKKGVDELAEALQAGDIWPGGCTATFPSSSGIA